MQTIGERLEEARKKKGISIREAAEATKIRGDYLQRFESNHFDIGLTEIYARGFLRTYANYLKLPADRIIADYTALGRGELRPRQPSREVYGRMDISVSSADSNERAAAPSEPAPTPAPEPSPANRGPQRGRTGSSLPTGLDPALVFKYVKIGGVVVIAILLLWIIKALFFTGQKSTSNANQAATTAPRGPVIGLIAVRPVFVKVARPNPHDSEADGEVVFSGTLSAGETKSIPRQSTLFITAEPRGNLDIEINGRRVNLGEMLAPFGANVNRGKIEAPRAAD